MIVCWPKQREKVKVSNLSLNHSLSYFLLLFLFIHSFCLVLRLSCWPVTLLLFHSLLLNCIISRESLFILALFRWQSWKMKWHLSFKASSFNLVVLSLEMVHSLLDQPPFPPLPASLMLFEGALTTREKLMMTPCKRLKRTRALIEWKCKYILLFFFFKMLS